VTHPNSKRSDASRPESSLATGLRLVASATAIIVGLYLVFGSATSATADGLFVGSIALVLAIYLWPGVTLNQSRIVAVVLLLVAAYAFIRGFGLFELALIRQLGGITAIVSGVILLLPFIRTLMGGRGSR